MAGATRRRGAPGRPRRGRQDRQGRRGGRDLRRRRDRRAPRAGRRRPARRSARRSRRSSTPRGRTHRRHRPRRRTARAACTRTGARTAPHAAAPAPATATAPGQPAPRDRRAARRGIAVRAPAGRGARRRPRDASPPRSPAIRSAPPTSTARPRAQPTRARCREPQRRTGRSGRGDAPGDRAADGPLQARDPALLPAGRHRAHGRARLARAPQRARVRSKRASCPAALLYKAVALAAASTPGAQRLLDRRSLRTPARGVHLGVAISLRGGGLVAPAIHDADQLSLARADGARCAISQHAPGAGACAARR